MRNGQPKCICAPSCKAPKEVHTNSNNRKTTTRDAEIVHSDGQKTIIPKSERIIAAATSDSLNNLFGMNSKSSRRKLVAEQDSKHRNRHERKRQKSSNHRTGWLDGGYDMPYPPNTFPVNI